MMTMINEGVRAAARVACPSKCSTWNIFYMLFIYNYLQIYPQIALINRRDLIHIAIPLIAEKG